MDTNRFDTWFDQEFPNWGVNAIERENHRSVASRAWAAALIAKDVPRPVDGNARFAGFGKPASVSEPNRPIMLDATVQDSLTIKHWNVWDTSRDQYAAIELTKQAAYYWAERYNKKEKRNIYFAVAVLNERV